MRWSLVASGVAKYRIGAPPACSRPVRVVCEGRRLGAAATDCELVASSRAEILGLDGLRSLISKAL